MKILLATNGFSPEIGGVQVYCYELTKNLTLLGEEIIVLAPETEGDSEFDKKAGFEIIRTRKKSASRFAFLSILRRKRIEKILIGHGSHYVRLAFLANLLLKIPYNIIVYLEEILPLERKKTIRKSFKRADRIVAISHFVKKRLMEIGIPGDKIVVIHPGIDPERFLPGPEPSPVKKRHHLENKKVILTIARLGEHKGHANVIRALPRVLEKASEAIYLVVGSGEKESRLKGLVKELGLKDKVIFTGEVEEEELPLYYAACDVFIMPSDIEGFGIVFLEANACGKPVIGGKVGGITDAIIAGETGLLVDPFDINQIADALVKLLTNSGLAQRLGKRGRERIEEELNWGETAKRIREIICQERSRK